MAPEGGVRDVVSDNMPFPVSYSVKTLAIARPPRPVGQNSPFLSQSRDPLGDAIASPCQEQLLLTVSQSRDPFGGCPGDAIAPVQSAVPLQGQSKLEEQ